MSFAKFIAQNSGSVQKVLCVAEKPSAARELTRVLSKGTSEQQKSHSQYNPVFRFDYKLHGHEVEIFFTSVTGHIMNLALEEKYGKTYWATAPHEDLFKDAGVSFVVEKSRKPLVKNLTELSKHCDVVLLWLDSDREGEAISSEVLSICKQGNANIRDFRASFSSFTPSEVKKAVKNLDDLNTNLVDSVTCRQEIDLRTGAAFTRFQTTLIQRNYFGFYQKIVSYGTCQIPTLGFVVARQEKIKNFVPEQYYTLHLNLGDSKKEQVKFTRDNGSIPSKEEANQLYTKLQQTSKIRVKEIEETETKKLKPYPLTTVTLQKLASNKLKFSSHYAMDLAERLYNKGYISYPRTETNSYPKSMNIQYWVKFQHSHPQWGEYAQSLTAEDEGGNSISTTYEYPIRGKRDDKAHPPIHPVRQLVPSEGKFTVDEIKLYEFITRYFLATCSKSATIAERKVTFEAEGCDEAFSAKQRKLTDRGYMEVYPYDTVNESNLPNFEVGQTFENGFNFSIEDKETTPPYPLTEEELIDQMDKNSIGTDATIHEHIKTIIERQYIRKSGKFFVPTQLGESVIEFYKRLDLDLYNPSYRAQMEQGMNDIAEGKIKKEDFLNKVLDESKEFFYKMRDNQETILETFKDNKYLPRFDKYKFMDQIVEEEKKKLKSH